jgi:hypothetical protein
MNNVVGQRYKSLPSIRVSNKNLCRNDTLAFGIIESNMYLVIKSLIPLIITNGRSILKVKLKNQKPSIAKKHRFIRLSECLMVWFTGFR